MSITAETAKEHAKDPAVLCCRAEGGITIQAANLEDPAIFDDLVDSGLLKLDGTLTIEQVLGAKLVKTCDSLTPLTADLVEGAKAPAEEAPAEEKKAEREEPTFDPEEQKKVAEEAKTFLAGVFAGMHLAVTMECRMTEERIMINLVGDGLGILIGKHGQTLDALQYLTNLAAGKSFRHHYFILLDVENYRERRQDTLEALARRLAGKVKRTGEEIRLEPMAAGERRIIHLALQDDHAVSTDSEGEAPYRYVVIRPKD